MSKDPYADEAKIRWAHVTQQLLDKFPLSKEDLVSSVLTSWDDIFVSKIGSDGFTIGQDIFPQPQILGFLLHELIPLKLQKQHPDEWCRDRTGHEKDLVSLADPEFSMEIKTSSSKEGIFGNRSFAQPESAGKKSKNGYYLLVNFEKCTRKQTGIPKILMIRFAWLSHSDWKGQTSQTGQQAALSADAKTHKMIKLYPNAKREL